MVISVIGNPEIGGWRKKALVIKKKKVDGGRMDGRGLIKGVVEGY